MGIRKIREESKYDNARVLHTCKVYRDSDFNEYRVTFLVDGVKVKDSDYFTDSKGDAIGTALNHIQKVTQ